MGVWRRVPLRDGTRRFLLTRDGLKAALGPSFIPGVVLPDRIDATRRGGSARIPGRIRIRSGPFPGENRFSLCPGRGPISLAMGAGLRGREFGPPRSAGPFLGQTRYRRPERSGVLTGPRVRRVGSVSPAKTRRVGGGRPNGRSSIVARLAQTANPGAGVAGQGGGGVGRVLVASPGLESARCVGQAVGDQPVAIIEEGHPQGRVLGAAELAVLQAELTERHLGGEPSSSWTIAAAKPTWSVPR